MGDRLPVLGRWWPTPALWPRDFLSAGLLLQFLWMLLLRDLDPLVQDWLAVAMPHLLYSVLTLTFRLPSQVLVLLAWVVQQTWPPPSGSLWELDSMEQWWSAVVRPHLLHHQKATRSLLQASDNVAVEEPTQGDILAYNFKLTIIAIHHKSSVWHVCVLITCILHGQC